MPNRVSAAVDKLVGPSSKAGVDIFDFASRFLSAIEVLVSSTDYAYVEHQPCFGEHVFAYVALCLAALVGDYHRRGHGLGR